MKKRHCNLFSIAVGFCLVASLISSCEQGPPPRKKMPNYLDNYDGIEKKYPFEEKVAKQHIGNCTFTTESVDLTTDGSPHACVSIALPDAGYDTDVMNLLATYKPLAIPLLTQWAKQNRNGVVVDLRANPLASSNSNREDYMIEHEDAFSFPVIFMWDDLSSSRADVYIALLKQIPDVAIRKTAQ